MSEGEEIKTTAVGTVEEVLPNSLFRVRLSEQTDAPSEASAHSRLPRGQDAFASHPRLDGRPGRYRTRPIWWSRENCAKVNVIQIINK